MHDLNLQNFKKLGQIVTEKTDCATPPTKKFLIMGFGIMFVFTVNTGLNFHEV